jgi:hypothetical protein
MFTIVSNFGLFIYFFVLTHVLGDMKNLKCFFFLFIFNIICPNCQFGFPVLEYYLVVKVHLYIWFTLTVKQNYVEAYIY